MLGSKPKETPEQRQQRLIAERENRSAMMDQAADRTKTFSRYMRPRLSIVTSRTLPMSRSL